MSSAPRVSSSGENTQTGVPAGEASASRPARASRPGAVACSAFICSVNAAVASAPTTATGSVLVVPSPATATHSTPLSAPSAAHSAATTSGTTICASFEEPAVLTTLPATVTGAWLDEVADDSPLELHAVSVTRVTAAARATSRREVVGGVRLRRIPQAIHRPGAGRNGTAGSVPESTCGNPALPGPEVRVCRKWKQDLGRF